MFSATNTTPRDKAVELLDSGLITADALLNECLQYMSNDDIEDVLNTLGFYSED